MKSTSLSSSGGGCVGGSVILNGKRNYKNKVNLCGVGTNLHLGVEIGSGLGGASPPCEHHPAPRSSSTSGGGGPSSNEKNTMTLA